MAWQLNLKTSTMILLASILICCFLGKDVFSFEVSGVQSGEWALVNSPYIITGDVEVPENMTLKINPGVVVKFAGNYTMTIHGTLEAIGQVGKRIVFTSVHDKEFGLTGRPTLAVPANGDWIGLEFAPSSQNRSQLRYCIIRYSEKAISAIMGSPILNNIIIADCKAKNLMINGKKIVVLEGNEHDYIPIETTLNENILSNTLSATTKISERPSNKPPAPIITTEDESIYGEITNLSKAEEFTFGEIEVVSATRREQKINEAPAAITVITEEDIKSSGAVTIPDILKMVPGLDVMQITASDLVINARGYNKEMSNKMLVLIDGRYVYWEFYGIILWDSFPIVLEDIKKIEIIRGPGSALYGANAFSGVINIITKSPAETLGTHIAASGGTYNTYLGSIIHAGEIDNMSYKLTLGLDETSQWLDKNIPGRDAKRVQAVVEYKIGENSKIAFEGGYNKGQGETLSGIGKMNRKQTMAHVKSELKLGNLTTRFFWSRSRGNAIQEPGFIPYYFIANTYDFESQHFFSLGAKNSIVLGGNFRVNKAESDLIDQNHRQNLMSGYIQDEFKPSDRLTFTFGLRYDIHPLVKNQLSPRANLLLSPLNDHYMRFSYGAAFRSPSFIESYLYENSDISSMVSPLLPANTVVVQARGNPELLPEKITSYEVGYQALLGPRFRAKIDLFYNNLWDFISFRTIAGQDMSALFGYPAGSVIVPSLKSYTNAGKSKAVGGEFGIEFLYTSWLMASINYSHQKLTWEEDDPLTPVNEKGQRMKSSPIHKINGGVRFKFDNGISGNFMLHYVGETEKNETWASGIVDAYTLINLRLGYRFLSGTTEIGLSVYNLMDKRHFEYPRFDNQGNSSGSHQIRRRITGIFLSRNF